LKKFLVYFPFPAPSTESGSGVRPTKLVEAFQGFAKEKNLECIVIMGTASERLVLLEKVYREVEPNDILFCYMENQTIPIWLTDPNHMPMHPLMDVKFFRYLKRNEIPLGIFYRDVYWKFDHLYTVNNPILKKTLIQLFKLELKIFTKYSKKIFLPSIAMNKYVGIADEKVISSPPGGIVRTSENHINKNNGSVTAVYVGGVAPRYGVYEVLEALEKLNSDGIKIYLKLVCREKEFQLYNERFQPYLGKEWLKIFHASGEKLIPIYSHADFGIVTLKNDIYNDFAVPVKLFEYLSYGLPVLASRTTAIKEIVEVDKFGLTVNDTVEDIKEGLKAFLNQQVREEYQRNAILALKTKHLWIHRVEEIFQALVK
jgi:glycosyltransferase involved in cell wall biosynthesis